MDKDTILHSVFETRNGKRCCVAVYDNNVEAQDCINRRKKWTNGTYDVILYKLGAEKEEGFFKGM